MSRFKEEFDLDTRQEKYIAMMQKYPNGVPVICEAATPTGPYKFRREFSVQREALLGHLLNKIRRSAKIRESEALFVLVGGTLHPVTAEMGSLYNWSKDEDGWLYVTWMKENTFGA